VTPDQVVQAIAPDPAQRVTDAFEGLHQDLREFKRDFILNKHWTPRGATAVWVIGMTFVLMAVFYYVGEVRGLRLTWLGTLGRTALFLYFVHQLIVLTLVNQYLHLRFNNWWRYAVANLLLLFLLLGLGRLWIEVKRFSRAKLASFGVVRRA